MMQPLDAAPLEPIPTPEGPPPTSATPRAWARDNLFSNWYNTVLTVIFGLLALWLLFRVARFVLVTGRWEIIEVNLTNFVVGRFPRDELHRIWIAAYIAAATIGVALGMRTAQGPSAPWWNRLRRQLPLLLLVAVLLRFTQTVVPLLLSAGALALALGARWLGRRIPARARRWVAVLYVVNVLAAFAAIIRFGGVGWDNWGGLLLTLFFAVGGILLSFPVGVLLALGRRSTFPAVRIVCVGYIEFIRGVPLITLLFMATVMLGFFFPPGFDKPEQATLSLIAFVMFTSGYVAEIVRGGLQGVPKGQVEAAQAIGLSPVRMTLLIVLPQALRNVLPALVGQFISLFKDTSLVVIVGLFDLLAVATVVTEQPAFRAQGLHAESLIFVSFVYWVFCYSMSRSSQRLEGRLGVGVR